MYKILKIGGKDYRLEYSIEASLYADCVESIADVLGSTAAEDNTGVSEKEQIKEMISGIANIPKTALTVFYAGLMEAHGNHPDGDGAVPDIATAKGLVKQFIIEHKDDETGSFCGILTTCLKQMEEDGFFKLIGLEGMVDTASAKKMPKRPQDHKKKAVATKTSAK